MTDGPSTASVTVVVSDLQGSTALGERLDPEALRAVMTRYLDCFRAALEARNGRIAKVIGDAVVALFDGSDGARRAVHAVLDGTDTLTDLNQTLDMVWGVRLVNRTGIATGPLAVDGEVLQGLALDRATLLEGAAPGAGCLLDRATAQLVDDVAVVGPLAGAVLKDGGGTIDAHELLGRAAASDSGVGHAPSESVCPGCGCTNPAATTRCAQCRSWLRTVPAEDRRTVTIVFADPKLRALGGSAVSSTAAAAALGQYAATVRPILERHGGTVERFIGDTLMAVFGLERRHEDDDAAGRAGRPRDARRRPGAQRRARRRARPRPGQPDGRQHRRSRRRPRRPRRATRHG